MNTGETILLIGALLIFSVSSFYTNQVVLESGSTVTETQVMNGATAVGLSYIEHAKQLMFDELSIANSDITDPAMLTLPADLGAETGESFSNFDDVDDFHNYTDSVTTELLTYYVTTNVVYVDTNNMNVSVSDQTFYKKLDVNVSTPFLSDTLRLVHIFSLWR